ncbi:MAG: hypothetical protein KGI38_12340 [Thaumarchaeota archaeon]|nr:hypothetical protein [Nitrososphaerota archaeon]
MKNSDWLYACGVCFAMGAFAVLGWQKGGGGGLGEYFSALLAALFAGGLGFLVYHLVSAFDRALLALFRWYIRRAKEEPR